MASAPPMPEAPPKYEEAIQSGAPPYPPQQGAPYPTQPMGYQAPPPAGYQGGPPPAGHYQPPPQGGYPAGYQAPPAGYQYPPAGYQPGPIVTAPTTTTVVVATTSRPYSSRSTGMMCPHCHQNIVTDVSRSPGGLVWLIAALICLFGGWALCCLIPFCITDLYDAEHSCPNCKHHLGTYKPL